MARDYAQNSRGGGRKQTRGRSGGGGGGMPGWVWLIFGLAIGLAVAAFVYIKRPSSTMMTADHASQAPAEPEEETKPKKSSKEALKLPPKEKARFTFYTLLPSEEVVIPRDDKEAAKAAAGDGSSYIIQAGSYRSREEADKQKATLALLGAEPRIETVTIDGQSTFYRVRIGPLKDFGKVQILSSRLEDNGIEALVVKVK